MKRLTICAWSYSYCITPAIKSKLHGSSCIYGHRAFPVLCHFPILQCSTSLIGSWRSGIFSSLSQLPLPLRPGLQPQHHCYLWEVPASSPISLTFSALHLCSSCRFHTFSKLRTPKPPQIATLKVQVGMTEASRTGCSFALYCSSPSIYMWPVPGLLGVPPPPEVPNIPYLGLCPLNNLKNWKCQDCSCCVKQSHDLSLNYCFTQRSRFQSQVEVRDYLYIHSFASLTYNWWLIKTYVLNHVLETYLFFQPSPFSFISGSLNDSIAFSIYFYFVPIFIYFTYKYFFQELHLFRMSHGFSQTCDWFFPYYHSKENNIQWVIRGFLDDISSYFLM